MQTLYAMAGVLAAVTGLAHSVLGERLIFRHLRRGGAGPTLGPPPRAGRPVATPCAPWHPTTNGSGLCVP